MDNYRFTTRGNTPALEYAAKELCRAGWLREADAPLVVLPIPSLDPDGHIKGGGRPEDLPKNARIIGGNLLHPALKDYDCTDLLKNPLYLSENAAITAHCALCIAMQRLPITLQDCPVLVVGWGRIGKCLVRLLRLLGARVTVAARGEADRALIAALGYTAVEISDEVPELSAYRVIYNTVPAMVLPTKKLSSCRQDCLKIDLASVCGIDGDDVIWARGLPNLHAPESSGQLIAKMIRKEFEV